MNRFHPGEIVHHFDSKFKVIEVTKKVFDYGNHGGTNYFYNIESDDFLGSSSYYNIKEDELVSQREYRKKQLKKLL